ncbi:hypothetical protein VSS37_20770, partial [Candidatus Thiothrix sp. Deng01]
SNYARLPGKAGGFPNRLIGNIIRFISNGNLFPFEMFVKPLIPATLRWRKLFAPELLSLMDTPPLPRTIKPVFKTGTKP